VDTVEKISEIMHKKVQEETENEAETT